MRLLTALVFFVASTAFGQRLSVGVIGGGSATDGFLSGRILFDPIFNIAGSSHYSESKDYLVGATVELRVLPRWSIEADGIYRKLHLTTAGVLTNGSLTGVSPSPVVTWEFPVLAKLRFAFGRVRPFVELGPSFRMTGNLNGTNPSHAGVTTGGGVEAQLWKLKVAPVVRYTRWAVDEPAHPYGFQLKSNPDQLELMVGVSVAAEQDLRPLGRRISAGAATGVDLTDGVGPQAQSFPGFGYSSHPIRSFIAGPTVEFEIGNEVSFEADAIYRRLRSEIVNTVNGVAGKPFTGSVSTWEIPVLAKYRFPTHWVRPFAEAGPSFRLPSGGVSNFGVAAGVGFETHLRFLKIAPTVRYTRWGEASRGSSVALPNQAELLVRFSL